MMLGRYGFKIRPLARSSAPLFAQVLALVLLSLIAAQAVNVGVIFSLPPPAPELYRVSEVVQVLQGGRVTPRDSPPLIMRRTRTPPRKVFVGRFSAEVLADFSRRLSVREADLVFAHEPPRWLPYADWRGSVHQRLSHISGGRDDHALIAPFEVGLHQADGSWLIVGPQPAFPTPWQTKLVLSFVLCALALAPVAYLFSKWLAAPISAFAAAAERLGRDPGAAPLQLSGSSEIARAVSAFNGMQDRLRRYVEDRTALVGAVAHDLRTPLTRLRFRIEGVPETLRLKMAADLDEMEAMISATLALMRDANRPADRSRLELVSLVERIADEMTETGLEVSAESSSPIVIEGDAVALRRLVTNLVDNAVKFGVRARARVYAEDGSAVIEVDDDGPGVPDLERDRVFEPFHRGEPSRSRDTGGAGLGLAVVRSIARAHGGDAELTNRIGGGLRARAHLPL